MVSAILNPGQGENAKPEAAPTTLVGMLEYLKLLFFFLIILIFIKGRKKGFQKCITLNIWTKRKPVIISFLFIFCLYTE